MSDPNHPIWTGTEDFGSGPALYRCMDITTRLGTSVFEYWNEKLQQWRRVNNYDVRSAMHAHISENYRDPF